MAGSSPSGLTIDENGNIVSNGRYKKVTGDNGQSYWEVNGNKYTVNPMTGEDANTGETVDKWSEEFKKAMEGLGTQTHDLTGVWKDSLDPLVVYLKQYAGDNRTLYEALVAGFGANDQSGYQDTIIDYAGWVMNSMGMDYAEWLQQNIGTTTQSAIASYLGSLGQSWGQVSEVISTGGNQVNGVIAEFAKEFKGVSAEALSSLATSLGINLVDLINNTGQNYDQASREFIQAINNSTSEWMLSFNDFKQAWEIVNKTIKGIGGGNNGGDSNLEDPVFHNQPGPSYGGGEDVIPPRSGLGNPFWKTYDRSDAEFFKTHDINDYIVTGKQIGRAHV